VAAKQAKRVLRSVCHGARAAVDALIDTLALRALQGEEAEAWLRFAMRTDTIRRLRLLDDWGMYPEGGILDRWERVEGGLRSRAWGFTATGGQAAGSASSVPPQCAALSQSACDTTVSARAGSTPTLPPHFLLTNPQPRPNPQTPANARRAGSSTEALPRQCRP
jgi:hypothetical protein